MNDRESFPESDARKGRWRIYHADSGLICVHDYAMSRRTVTGSCPRVVADPRLDYLRMVDGRRKLSLLNTLQATFSCHAHHPKHRLRHPCLSVTPSEHCVDPHTAKPQSQCILYWQAHLVRIYEARDLLILKSINIYYQLRRGAHTDVELLKPPLTGDHCAVFLFLFFLANCKVDQRSAVGRRL